MFSRCVFVVFVCFLCYCWFSLRLFLSFVKKKRSGKHKQKTTTTTNKPISKGGSETFKNFVIWVVCVFLVFFSVLCCFVFSQTLVLRFVKKVGKTSNNNNNNKTHPYPRVGLKPLKALVVGFPESCVWCSFVFFCIFGFIKGFVCVFFKNVRENLKTKSINPYPRVGLKPLKTLFLLFSRRFCLVFFGFLLYLLFSQMFVHFCCLTFGETETPPPTKTKHIQGWF